MKKYFIYIGITIISLISCEEILIEEDLSDDTVTLIAPVDGSTVANASVNFSWEAVDPATSYRLQIARPSFASAVQVVKDTTLALTSFSTTLTSNTYEWRVRAQNAGSNTVYTSAAFSVTESDNFPARDVVLLSPQNNQIINTATITLTWEQVTDATTYRVQLLDDTNQVIDEQAVTTTSAQFVFPEGTTTWQVRAENDTQNTLYSSRTITVDSTNPAKPVGTTPANQATLTSTSVDFSWTRELIEGTTEFDSIYVYRDQQLTDLVTKDQATAPTTITLGASSTYFWVVQAFDEAGNESETSDTLTFSIN
ncbi:hypothetical protein [Aquimarina brevivitae]|uniref:Fibronectin type-III domain-containing protein n=1 Tax=Aquimarina brevivitae TaxID=323412 RepID=A0A4Q7PEG1_9FLAO|nr:hypothetical protein [Aquimarina brevivitae]RZS98806.1 hypothetical protein EV197_0006 [Aquimarina brevivitae]